MNTNHQKIKIIFLIIISILFLSFSSYSYAAPKDEESALLKSIEKQSSTFGTTSGLKTKDTKELQESIVNIINVILGFLGLLLLIIIIYSGFEWMTSGGNEEKISAARKRLLNATIGLGIILGAWIIAQGIMYIVQGKDAYWGTGVWL